MSESDVHMLLIKPEASRHFPGFKPALDDKGNRVVHQDNWQARFRARHGNVSGSQEVGRGREDLLSLDIHSPGFIGRTLSKARGKQPKADVHVTRAVHWQRPGDSKLFKD